MKYVKWTASEERKVAVRAEAIRTNPEVSENRLPTGQRCKSLAMAYGLAQMELEPARRKANGTFHAAGGAKLAANHAAVLAEIKRGEELAAREAAENAERERSAKAARTPPPPPPDPLAPLKLLLGDVLAQAVAEGILRAAAALDIPIRAPGAGPAVHHHGNGNGANGGEHHAAVAAVAQALTQRTHRTPVDVVGLKGGQRTIVEKSPVAQAFDIRFIPADSHMRNRDARDDVVICTKFVNHHNRNRYNAGSCRVHYANGGPQSVIEQLERMAQASAQH